MAMGLKSSGEIFQMKNYETFGDISGVFMIVNDMLIAGKDEPEHNAILKEVFRRAKEKNIKFNTDKIKFKVSSVRYMGNIILADGMKPDTKKVVAILTVSDPVDKPGVQRLLGTVNFLAARTSRTCQKLLLH